MFSPLSWNKHVYKPFSLANHAFSIIYLFIHLFIYWKVPRPQIAMNLDDCLLHSVNQTSMPKGMHIGWWLPWRVSPTFASQTRHRAIFSSTSIPSETRSLRTCAKRLRTSQTSQVRWIHSGSVWEKEWKNWGWKAGSSSPWCSCQRMNSIPHRWWFFQGAGNSKSWSAGRWFLDNQQHLGGLMTYLKHNLSFQGLPTSKLRNLNPLSFVLQPSTHVCSIWHCRKFLIIPLAIFKGPNICHMLPQSNGLHWISDVNGQNHVPSGKLT